MGVWADLAYLVAALCFVLALKGLSGPRTARAGNLLGAAGAALAVLVTLVAGDIDHLGWILGGVAVGAVVGVPMARRVPMTAMPQLVALFNGVGGGAAALVAFGELVRAGGSGSAAVAVATVFTVFVGAVSLSGSVTTYVKLAELMTTRPVVLPAGRWISSGTLGAAVVVAVVAIPTQSVWLLAVLAVLTCGLGVLFVLPVGGADVPIAISLLNAVTGLSVAASGYVLGNVLLIVAGTLVGAAGTLLTRLMAQAMGRPLADILFGAFTAAPVSAGVTAEERPVRSGGPEDVAILLAYARKVVVVPGYGLAVAQAQHTLAELAGVLTARGVEVMYGIHPVAGRMPGHMNVLLAEAEVPYEQLRDMEQANPELSSADVALVVGANDVVNPAARNDPGSPIHGMPIIDVDAAQHVVFCKRSMRPGFAGIDNALLYHPRTTMLFGDARESMINLVTAVKAL